ncbi:rhomboid family intramembrane serine protease [Marinibactrum halimedae]|uniref:Peptidase S54 rhomboid domain-containing protein n=1 Tax=Marinibactrum halimedae TaxID=1444977 RepID=A0AA37T711_9GAMM|nr:rhomboid family intramembrane serine protease [Marinibactrum halimedae]MCD9457745.1 rhomboid family intramembrane serine protease [Marinibactrum halimedae]GLS24881.1 hypothetical protein GCM10007877_05950 [Marinibactrum halimedae]
MIILPTEKKIDWKKPPVVLCVLVLLNLLVFMLYQWGDSRRMETALEIYRTHELLNVEWKPYQDYWLRYHDSPIEDIIEYRESFPEEFTLELMFDQRFYEFLEENLTLYKPAGGVKQWQLAREEVNAAVNKVSSRAFGLSVDNLSVVSLISHQFLHGGVGHLLGNLLFLIVCGFAVEAALGHGRFLALYIVSGAAGGLFYCLFASLTKENATPLVGASGAISGVMAMYCMLFQLRKIEFFYFIFVLVGYFRAPALAILPVYIGSELLQWLTTSDSNVAYSAHLGGFLAGGVGVLLVQYYDKHAIDQEYIEEDQSVDDYLVALDRVYRTIADYRFESARKLVADMIETHGQKSELMSIQLNIMVAIGGTSLKDYLLKNIHSRQKGTRLGKAQAKLWRSLSERERASISPADQVSMAVRILDACDVELSESIFTYLKARQPHEASLAKLARKLAWYYEREGILHKKNEYNRLADELMGGFVR